MKHTHGEKWNEETIKEGILEVIKALNTNRMPTRVEIENLTGNSALTNIISKKGGFRHWAEKLGLDTKESDTNFGIKGEELAEKILVEKGYKVEQMTVKHPYDILVNDDIKIDIKTSRRYYYKDDNYMYSFRLEKRYPTCDLYMFLCIHEDKVEKVMIIPSKFLHQTQVSIGEQSKYDQYIDRYDYIESYDKLYKSII